MVVLSRRTFCPSWPRRDKTSNKVKPLLLLLQLPSSSETFCPFILSIRWDDQGGKMSGNRSVRRGRKRIGLLMSWPRCPSQDIILCPGQDVLSKTSWLGHPGQDVVDKKLCPGQDVLSKTSWPGHWESYDWLRQVRDTFVTKGYFQPSWKRNMCMWSIWVRNVHAINLGRFCASQKVT